MKTTMVVYMRIHDDGWIAEYFDVVPKLLAEYGAVTLSAGRELECIEGDANCPDRIAVIEFPSREALDGFWWDPRYQPYKKTREGGTSSQIFIYGNAAAEAGFA